MYFCVGKALSNRNARRVKSAPPNNMAGAIVNGGAVGESSTDDGLVVKLTGGDELAAASSTDADGPTLAKAATKSKKKLAHVFYFAEFFLKKGFPPSVVLALGLLLPAEIARLFWCTLPTTGIFLQTCGVANGRAAAAHAQKG
jgi:hypothetical protein